ncbi:ferric reductase-like transmembrane domain-containing protein [Thermodesulfobacteriota bacterium]
MQSKTAFTRQTRIALGALGVFVALLLMAAAWTIPFVFESSTLFYKFGLEKVLLRSGKVAGVTAAVLIFFQIVLISRFNILDKIFGLNHIFNIHRINGMVIAALALLHPILILAAEGFTLFPLEMRYWPEFLGIGLSVLILGIVIMSNWRLVCGVSYDIWLHFHRQMVLGVIAIEGFHIIFVSDTFESGFPRTLIFVVIGLNLPLIINLWRRRLFPGKWLYAVSAVTLSGDNFHILELRPIDDPGLPYLPGQFVFITPVSENLRREEHPFTLASSPSRPNTLQFIIRSIGDWTNQIDRLKIEERVFIDGPYGIFSHKAYPGDDPLILIAGGVGITPMLSMLRFMTDTNDRRPVQLIWSNKTRESIVLPEVFEELKGRLKQLKIMYIITRSGSGADDGGRLDRAKLDQLLEGCSRKSRIFICGPPGMMKEVNRALKAAGFMATRIHTEKFRF